MRANLELVVTIRLEAGELGHARLAGWHDVSIGFRWATDLLQGDLETENGWARPVPFDFECVPHPRRVAHGGNNLWKR